MVMIVEGIFSSPSSNGAPRKGKPSDHHAANRFYVRIPGGVGKDGGAIEAVFTEVSGLQVEMQVTDYEEGGENTFVHRLPGRLKVSNITLKHGLVKSDLFLKWVMRAAHEKPMDRRNISVVLFDQAGGTVVCWNFSNAFPVKWVGPQVTAHSTTMAIESVELAV